MTTNLRFRGWSPSTKKMVSCCDLIHGKAVEDGYTWENQPTNDLIPLMWTGLCDTDAVPIYEGDFIYTKVNQHFWVYCVSAVEGFGNSLKAVLIFDNVTTDGEYYTFEVRDHRNSDRRTVVDIPYGDKVRIVGNIYENPDYHPSVEYKKHCDEVLLSRGKSGRLPIPSGMS
jgi:hypothetical protein